MIQQDSEDPDGVSADGRETNRKNLVRARERKANAAIQLSLAGATWAEIAQSLGYPTPRAAKVATEKALEKALVSGDDRDKMRDMANQRLNRLLRGVWQKAIDPDHPEHLLAVTKAREIIAQHAKLFGLDAPAEFVVHAPSEQALEEWVASVVALKAPDVEEYDILDIDGVEIEDDDDGEGGVPALVGA